MQCNAGSRPRRGTGPVLFIIDESTTESETDFIYTDDPQIFSLQFNKVIRRYVQTIMYESFLLIAVEEFI